VDPWNSLGAARVFATVDEVTEAAAKGSAASAPGAAGRR
jgi:hypothetical protein